VSTASLVESCGDFPHLQTPARGFDGCRAL
jgi:hypothetical protein